jgi:hypothetical protein
MYCAPTRVVYLLGVLIPLKKFNASGGDRLGSGWFALWLLVYVRLLKPQFMLKRP